MQRATGLFTSVAAVAATVAALAAGLVFSGCDTAPENANQVTEGQGIKLGDLLYNVQITRILNPGDAEDKAYLAGQKQPGPDQYYLAVFMRIDNEGDTDAQVARDFKVVDTVGDTFAPIPSDSLFALKLGATIHGGDQLPEGESTAANGPIQGSMVLFRITGAAIQDRPLTLEIPSSTGTTGRVELDI
jgi:predicted component of type VI protein secretion system